MAVEPVSHSPRLESPPASSVQLGRRPSTNQPWWAWARGGRSSPSRRRSTPNSSPHRGAIVTSPADSILSHPNLMCRVLTPASCLRRVRWNPSKPRGLACRCSHAPAYLMSPHSPSGLTIQLRQTQDPLQNPDVWLHLSGCVKHSINASPTQRRQRACVLSRRVVMHQHRRRSPKIFYFDTRVFQVRANRNAPLSGTDNLTALVGCGKAQVSVFSDFFAGLWVSHAQGHVCRQVVICRHRTFSAHEKAPRVFDETRRERSTE